MATIASLVVSIGADIAELRRGVDEGNAKIDTFATRAVKTFDAITKAAAFGVVASGIRQIVSAAAEIDDLAARIDDTATNVQRLQAVSEQFDVEITAVVGAIQEMEARLSKGEIHTGLAKLNINVAQFEAMSPAERYLAVADALGRVDDKSERVAIAAEVMGKHWKANTGAFSDGVDSAQRWVSMSDETVGAIDSLSTAFVNATKSAINFVANAFTQHVEDGSMNEAIDGIKRYAEELEKIPNIPNAPKIGGAYAPPGMPSKAALDEVEAQTKRLIADSAAYRSEHDKAATAIRLQSERFRDVVTYFNTADNLGTTFRQSVEDSAEEIADIRVSMEAMDAIRFNDTWIEYQQGVRAASEDVERIRQQMQQIQTWRGVGESLANAVIGALQGGGDVGKALGGEVGKQLGTQLGTKIGDWAGKSIGGSLGAAISGIAGTVMPVVGTLLGSLAGSAIGKLFGGEGKKVNDLRDGFVAAAGGIHELNVKAQEAGLTLDRLLRAKNVKDYQAAIEELNAALDEQAKLNQRGLAAMEKYGITIEQAGQKFKQTQMNATAKDLLEDFHALVNVGVDTDVIIEKMGGSINDFVKRSMAMGTKVPIELQRIIAKMIENKQLVNESGEAFTDLGQIPWAEGPDAAMSKLIEKIDKLLEKLGVELPKILNNLPRAIDIDINGNINIPGVEAGVPALAEGGLVRKPTLALVGEAGPEAVVPLTRFGQLQAANKGGGEVHIHMHNPILTGYSSAVTAAREMLDVLSQESERRGRSLAFGAA